MNIIYAVYGAGGFGRQVLSFFKLQFASNKQKDILFCYIDDNSNLDSTDEVEIQNNELEKDKTQELVDWAKNNMIKGANYVCKETPMFAEADWGDYWIH